DRRRPDRVPGIAALRRKALAPVTPPALLILHPDAVHFPAGPLTEVAGFPAFDIAGDVDPLDLGIDRGAGAAGLLLQLIGDIHLVRPAFVLRLGGTVAGIGGGHRPLPHVS